MGAAGSAAGSAGAARPKVHGVRIDAMSRCGHWDGPHDIVAIRFPCCGCYFACHACHQAVADHLPERWPRDRFDEPALLCGACSSELTIEAYLRDSSRCAVCGVAFNPRCVLHHPLYFE